MILNNIVFLITKKLFSFDQNRKIQIITPASGIFRKKIRKKNTEKLYE